MDRSEGVEAAFLDWIPIDRRQCAMGLGGLYKLNRWRCQTYYDCHLGIPIDRSPDATKRTYFRKLHDCRRRAKRNEITFLTRGEQDGEGRISSKDLYKRHHWSWVLMLREGSMVRAIMLECSSTWTWDALINRTLPGSHVRRVSDDRAANTYKWWGRLKDYRSYWGTSFGSDHALICFKLFACFGGGPKRTIQPWSDYNKLIQFAYHFFKAHWMKC